MIDENISSKDYAEITELWEASVRATHHFLPESDIQYFKPLILNEFLKAVNLTCIRDASGRIQGFSGVLDGKLEMLFIHPECRGTGIGKILTKHALQKQGVTKVDVNEQNEQAVGFYKKIGFQQVGRSPVDSMGKPYPMLHMELKN